MTKCCLFVTIQVYIKKYLKVIVIKKSLSQILLLILAGTGMVSAKMFMSANNVIDNGQIGFHLSNTPANSMYLGKWKNLISNKLNPSYFNSLADNRLSKNVSNQLLDISYLPNYTNNINQFIVPVFTDNILSSVSDGNIYFLFATNNVKFNPVGFESSITNFNPGAYSKISQPTLLEQEYYTPGYIISNGNSSFGVAAILVQQSFLDDSLGLLTLASSSSSNMFFDETQRTINRGTGYQLNFTQRLTNSIDVTFDYQSQINMNEFDAFGQSYSDSGDFDIPSQSAVSIGLPLFGNRLNFFAERISYSNIIPTVHSGYSQAFLNVFQSAVKPSYKLDDLIVYSASFEQNINQNFSWNFEVTSRQQAPATAVAYDRILTEDTASVSYKIGVTHTASLGQFNFFASFANKPLFIGGTDFGRLSSTSLNSHIEGVASWSFQF